MRDTRVPRGGAICGFLRGEAGAVTVDWVVLTAATIGLGLLVVSQVSRGAVALGSAIGNSLAGASVQPLGDLVGEPPPE